MPFSIPEYSLAETLNYRYVFLQVLFCELQLYIIYSQVYHIMTSLKYLSHRIYADELFNYISDIFISFTIAKRFNMANDKKIFINRSVLSGETDSCEQL